MSLRIPLDEQEFNYAQVAARARRAFDRTPVIAEWIIRRRRSPRSAA